jgi:hypothetical protein
MIVLPSISLGNVISNSFFSGIRHMPFESMVSFLVFTVHFFISSSIAFRIILSVLSFQSINTDSLPAKVKFFKSGSNSSS